ncbi:MAG: hypothetical protein IPP26_11880 [Flavobacteriales bacterium]|nr:hypothetical protein [Flavobacteriales bacterium]
MNTNAHEQLNGTQGHRVMPEPYDPTELVELARQQWPTLPELAEALAHCTTTWRIDEDLFQMIAPGAPDWTRAALVELHHPSDGPILVELMRHTTTAPGHFRIGSVDLLGFGANDIHFVEYDATHAEAMMKADEQEEPATTLRIVR